MRSWSAFTMKYRMCSYFLEDLRDCPGTGSDVHPGLACAMQMTSFLIIASAYDFREQLKGRMLLDVRMRMPPHLR